MHESTLSGNYHATVMDMNWYNFEVINIEEEFGVQFTNDEVTKMQNIGDLKKILALKIPA